MVLQDSVFEVGTVLAGKYRVDRVIGRGGMGVVAAATHVVLGQQVALKFLLPNIAHDPEVIARFVREARASAQLRGEHVCRVADVGTFDDGSPYLVMELLDGDDLAGLVERGGPLPIRPAVDFVLQACLGIAEAHSLGIVHRDLKPGNLFLTRRPDGRPLIKVLDFGIAKALRDGDFRLTRTQSILGSPAYMSPEQLRSTRDVDARADIWALGVIIYELVTGGMPFGGESITELALRVTMDPPAPLPPGTPYGFDGVVYRCLAKDPAERFPDVASLAHALAPYGSADARRIASAASRLLGVPEPLYVHDAPTQIAPPLIAPATSFAAPAPPPYPRVTTTIGSASRSLITPVPLPGRRVGWSVAAAIAIAVLAIAGFVIARGGDPELPAAAPAPPPTVRIEPTTVVPDAPAVDAAIDAAAAPAVEPPPAPAPPPAPPRRRPKPRPAPDWGAGRI